MTSTTVNLKAAKEAIADLTNAYVPAEEKVLDPTLIDKPLLERMPDPTGWRILILPYQGKGKVTVALC